MSSVNYHKLPASIVHFFDCMVNQQQISELYKDQMVHDADGHAAGYTHLCADGTKAVSDAVVQAAPFLLPLGPSGLLSLPHEPLVDDPRHAVVPGQRSSRRPCWNSLQSLQPALYLLPRHWSWLIHPTAHSPQELCDHAVAVGSCRFARRLGGTNRALVLPSKGALTAP